MQVLCHSAGVRRFKEREALSQNLWVNVACRRRFLAGFHRHRAGALGRPVPPAELQASPSLMQAGGPATNTLNYSK
jgi:hypothetical protein